MTAEANNDYASIGPEYPLIEDLLPVALKKLKVPQSITGATERGWSRMSAFQRCPFFYAVRYKGLEVPRPIAEPGETPLAEPEPFARAVGTLGHAMLALYYMSGIVAKGDWRSKMSSKRAWDLLDLVVKLGANPEITSEVERVINGYWGRFPAEADCFRPLAAEWDGIDREGNTCRYDLVAAVEEDQADFPVGIYGIDHKLKSKFDKGATEWANDGEIIGQILSGQHESFVKRFGQVMTGAIVNVIGRQVKEQKFLRIVVPAEPERHESHWADVRMHRAVERVYEAAGVWPRSRAGCISQYGLCDHYNACAGR